MSQSLKNLPAVQETWVRSLGWEDPLEKEMAAHSSILAWKILWTEETGELQSTGSQSGAPERLMLTYPGGSVVKNPLANEGDTDSVLELGGWPGEGNGHLLQDSCLGNPWTEEPGGLQYMGSQKVGHRTERLNGNIICRGTKT